MSQDEGPTITFRQIKEQPQDKRMIPPKNGISAAAVSENYIAIGMFNGLIEIYDADTNKKVETINENITNRPDGLSFDTTGNYLLATWYEKLIYCKNIKTKKESKLQYEQRILASAIDPYITTAQDQTPELSCVFSDDKGNVIRVRPRKAFFSSGSSFKVIATEPNTTIDTMVWQGDYICWASSNKFSIYRAKTEELVISRNIENPNEWYRACFNFLPNDIIHVSVGGSTFEVQANLKNTATKLSVDFGIYNSVSTNGNRAFLMYKNGDQPADPNTQPKADSKYYIRAIRGTEEYKVDISPEFQMIQSGNFQVILPQGDHFVLVYYTFVIIVSFSTLLERITFYLDRENFSRAIELTQENNNKLDEDERRQIIDIIASKQIEKGKVDDAVSLMLKYIGQEYGHMYDFFKATRSMSGFDMLYALSENQDLWKISQTAFSRQQMTSIILSLINNGKIKTLEQTMHKFAAQYAKDAFDEDDIAKTLKEKAMSNSDYELSLMFLDFCSSKPASRDDGYKISIKPEIKKRFNEAFVNPSNNDSDNQLILGTFSVIDHYDDYKLIMPHLLLFYKAHGQHFIDFITNHLDKMSPTTVLEHISGELSKAKAIVIDPKKQEETMNLIEHFKLDYLDLIWDRNSPEIHYLLKEKGYATDLVVLYLKYDHKNTLKFVQENTDFTPNDARDAATKYNRIKAAAYLCKRTGDNEGGMKILLDNALQEEDIVAAIEYAKNVDDKTCWGILTKYAYDSIIIDKSHSKNPPKFSKEQPLKMMLRDLPNLHINPVNFIKGIPDKLPLKNYIEDADFAVKQFNRKFMTAQLTHDIVAKDAFGAFQRSFQRYKRGKPVTNQV